jgi:hypothetical protein
MPKILFQQAKSILRIWQSSEHDKPQNMTSLRT